MENCFYSVHLPHAVHSAFYVFPETTLRALRNLVLCYLGQWHFQLRRIWPISRAGLEVLGYDKASFKKPYNDAMISFLFAYFLLTLVYNTGQDLGK